MHLSLTPPQSQIFRSSKRFKIIVAGRRFGKSYYACVELINQAISNPHSINWFVAPTYQMSKDIGWKTLIKLLPATFIKSKNSVELSVILINGSEIQFKSADRPDRLKGLGLNFVVLDEASQIRPQVWFESVRPALADKLGKALLITTPQGVSNWIYDLYQQAASSLSWGRWQFTTLQGGNVPPQEIDEAKLNLDERTFKQEFLASFESVVGLVYYAYVPSHNSTLLEPADFPTLHCGVDFNIQKMAAVITATYKDSLYVVGELINLYDTHELIDVLWSKFRSWCEADQLFIYPDASGSQRNTSASQTDLQLLRNSGLQVLVPPHNPRVRDRVSTLNSLFCSSNGKQRLFLNQKLSPFLHQALLRQTYTPHGEPDKSGDWSHCLDALGYVAVGTQGLLIPRLRSQTVLF